MKLNPEDLHVATFATAEAASPTGPIIVISDPTLMTHCFWCPPATVDW